MSTSSPGGVLMVAKNRRAFHEFEIEEKIEAGLMLTGTEVKSLRNGRANIAEAHAGEMAGELWVFNVNIPEFKQGNRFNHEPRRPRKLLLKKKELGKWLGAVQRKGMAIVPLSLYFKRGLAKIELGLGRGKKLHDKRATDRDRDWNRQKQRIMRGDKNA